MSRTYTYTRTGTTFTTGESAPSPREVIGDNVLVPNNYGNIALNGFRVDPTNRLSSVVLDATVEPPVLHLNEALTMAVSGYTDTATGQFVAYTEQMPGVRREVSGTYAGPDSELFVV